MAAGKPRTSAKLRNASPPPVATDGDVAPDGSLIPDIGSGLSAAGAGSGLSVIDPLIDLIPSPGGIIGAGVGATFDVIRPYLKITAGGLLFLVSAVTLVWVGGRQTPVGGAVEGAVAGAKAGPAGAAVGAASGATGGAERSARRKALRSELATARDREAREEARSRVVTDEGSGRVRKVSRAKGRENRESDAIAMSEAAELRSEQNRANLEALRSKRKRATAGPRTKVSA